MSDCEDDQSVIHVYDTVEDTVETDNIHLFKRFIMGKIDINRTLKYVIKRQFIEIFNFIVKNFNVDKYIDEIDILGIDNYDMFVYFCKRQSIEYNTFDYAKIGSSVNVLSKLIEKLKDVDDIDVDGRNLLHYACENSKLQLCKYLINYCDVNSMDNRGETPLALVIDKLVYCNNNKHNIVMLFIKSGKLNYDLINYLDMSIKIENINMIELFIDKYVMTSAQLNKIKSFYRDTNLFIKIKKFNPQLSEQVDAILAKKTISISVPFDKLDEINKLLGK